MAPLQYTEVSALIPCGSRTKPGLVRGAVHRDVNVGMQAHVRAGCVPRMWMFGEWSVAGRSPMQLGMNGMDPGRIAPGCVPRFPYCALLNDGSRLTDVKTHTLTGTVRVGAQAARTRGIRMRLFSILCIQSFGLKLAQPKFRRGRVARYPGSFQVESHITYREESQ
jgi:hypothetical protein